MQVMAAMSVASAMAGKGTRSRLYRPTNSAAMCAASVALPAVAEEQDFMTGLKGAADDVRDLYDLVGMVPRKAALDLGAVVERLDGEVLHGAEL